MITKSVRIERGGGPWWTLGRRLLLSHGLTALGAAGGFWLWMAFGAPGAELGRLVALGLALGTWLAVSRWVERSITLPLTRLQEGVRRIGEGAVGTELPHRPPDVIGELALTIASTGVRLGELHSGLWKANRELEQRVSERTREIEERNLMLESVVDTISHDLRATVISMQGLAAALLGEDGPLSPPEAERALRRLLAMTEHQERLLSDLVTLVRIGKEPPQWSAVDLERLLRDVIDGCREEAPIQPAVTLPERLPIVFADRARLASVFAHLVGNAVKFTGAQASPEIEIRVEEREGWVECSVKDNGIGIDPAYHRKVFDLFHRLREVEAPGTGAGLAIVKAIVERSGGRVWVESEKGRGTTVSFTIPNAFRQAEPRHSEVGR